MADDRSEDPTTLRESLGLARPAARQSCPPLTNGRVTPTLELDDCRPDPRPFGPEFSLNMIVFSVFESNVSRVWPAQIVAF